MATQIKIDIDTNDLKKMIKNHLENILNVELEYKDIEISVKTKQNYRAEWEKGEFAAKITKMIL